MAEKIGLNSVFKLSNSATISAVLVCSLFSAIILLASCLNTAEFIGVDGSEGRAADDDAAEGLEEFIGVDGSEGRAAVDDDAEGRGEFLAVDGAQIGRLLTFRT